MAETIAVRFGRRLRVLRQRRGWTQLQLGEKLGLDRGYISDIENGKRNVSLEVLEIIATGFEMSVSGLLSGI
jgi:transcriptional regulator with XRE-family HTH domain